MTAKPIEFGPLDVVISGWALQYATEALGFLERDPKSKISPSQLCTLDNFIKAILFSDRIFVTRQPSNSYPDSHWEAIFPVFLASSEAESLFKKEHIFESILELETGKIAEHIQTCRTVLKPVEVPKSPFCVISYNMKDGYFSQEMLVQDCVLIEDAISQCGAQRFEPVFPGDALYLGLRETRIPTQDPIETITHIATGKIRNTIKTEMERLNKTVVLGGLPFPLYPPLFVNRILSDISPGSDIVPTIIETRNSRAMKKFRDWISQCMEWVSSEDLGDRRKLAEAYEALTNFEPRPDMDRRHWAKGVLNAVAVGADAVMGSPGEAISAVGSAIINYVVGPPFAALQSKKGDEDAMQTFLQTNFGDRFDRQEMDLISVSLGFPESIPEWKRANPQLDVSPGRLDSTNPSSARPCGMCTKDAGMVKRMQKTFDEHWKESQPLTG